MAAKNPGGSVGATVATRQKSWRDRFLAALREGTTVAEACRHAGIARSTAYRERQRDEQFADKWEAIEESVTDELEAEAVRRAKDGSDTLLIFLLKSRRPEVYVERHRHRIETKSQPGGLPWIDREEVERLRRIAFQTWGDQLDIRPEHLLPGAVTLDGDEAGGDGAGT